MDTDHQPPGGDDELREDATPETHDANEHENRTVDASLEFRRQRAADLDGAREVRRFNTHDVELREVSDGTLRFTGYASVTERAYEVGDFEETIARGAFKRTLSENPDVVLLLNHDGLPLARTKSGTLTLSEDARGLRVDADLNPADPDVQRVKPKLERGDVDEMSFAFRATSQDWNEDYTQRRITGATIHRGDVSIVTYGANDASTGGIVGALRELEGELMEVRSGKSLSAKNRTEIQSIIDAAQGLLDNSDVIAADPTPTSDGLDALAATEVEREAEPPPATVILLPDHTTQRRERLAVLRGGRR